MLAGRFAETEFAGRIMPDKKLFDSENTTDFMP